MKILILSSATGGGHNAAGEAVKETLQNRGHEVVMMDMFSLSSERTARIVGQCYVNIAKTLPRFFGFIYRVGGVISSSKRKSPVYYANGLMAKKLGACLAENHFDAVVMPHLFPAETITYLKKHHKEVPLSVAISTDYTCIPFWEETNCDFYILPHEDLVEEYRLRGIPAEKLIPLGIPTRQAFHAVSDPVAAKQKLGLPGDKPLFLVMSGSMGFGKIYLFAYELIRSLKKGEQVVIICGSNEKLQHNLKRQFGKKANVHIIGYTTHVADYMNACDVIYTKPGGLSSTEALNSQVPIVHTAPIPGCENRNRDFFVSRGLSIAAERIRAQVKQGRLLVENKEIRSAMQSAQRATAHPDAALCICEFLEAHTGHIVKERDE